tara:strand:+ start:80 stop:367 length:288 start_codon:yes stop_codon:yes gene_type:complete
MGSIKKQIIIIGILIVVVFLSIKISISVVQNSIVNILKSEKFHVFLINQIEYHLVTYANSLNNYQEKKYVIKDSLKKILIEWKPIFEQLEQEINN